MLAVNGVVLSTVKTATDGFETFPSVSITKRLYVPAVAGARIEVAVPVAVVIIELVANVALVAVPTDANQKLSVEDDVVGSIVIVAPPCTATEVVNTESSFAGIAACAIFGKTNCPTNTKANTNKNEIK